MSVYKSADFCRSYTFDVLQLRTISFGNAHAELMIKIIGKRFILFSIRGVSAIKTVFRLWLAFFLSIANFNHISDKAACSNQGLVKTHCNENSNFFPLCGLKNLDGKLENTKTFVGLLQNTNTTNLYVYFIFGLNMYLPYIYK